MRTGLVLDARLLHTGIGTYIDNITLACRQLSSTVPVTAIVPKNERTPLAHQLQSVVTARSSIYGVYEQLEIAWHARRASLLHVPHYNFPIIHRGRLIVTIHDLVHLHTPKINGRAPRAYARVMLTLASRRAELILTVSEASKRDIVETLGAKPDRVRVIHNGVRPGFRPLPAQKARRTVAKALGVRSPYLLYVGNLKPHKNLPVLLQAITRLDHQLADLRLILVGDDRRGGPQIRRQISDLALGARVTIVPQVGLQLLRTLYVGAAALIAPSLIEGFCYPVAEAMACGTPVICARASALPEVGGEAPKYFAPNDCEELATAIAQVVLSEDLSQRMRERGLRQSARFSWSECARQHLELYRHFLVP
ncbi:MAG: glycosyltransferase family 4 protein [Terriglobales bacterium]